MEREFREFGALTLDADSVLQSVSTNHPLPRRLSRLLQALLDAGGSTVPKEKLLDRAWGKGGGSEQSLTRAVADLRRVMGTDNEVSIQTIYGVGYRLQGQPGENSISTREQALSICREAEHRLIRRDAEQMLLACDLFRMAAEYDPRCVEAQIGLAKTHIRLGVQGSLPSLASITTARKALADAIAIDPNCAEAFALLGWIHTCIERDDESAWHALCEAKLIAPVTSFLVNYYLGWFWLSRGEHARSIEAFELALVAEPASTNGIGWLGFAQLLSAPETARETVSRAMKLDSSNANSLWHYCIVEAAVGDTDAAVEAGARIHQLWPDIPIGRAACAFSLARAGSATEARKVLAGTNAREARWAGEEAFSALVHHALGDYELAVQTLVRAKDRYDGHFRPVLQLLPLTELEKYPEFRMLRRSTYSGPVDTFSAG